MFGKVSESKIVSILEKRINILEKREDDLLNRLMAKSHGEYVLGREVINEEKREEPFYPDDALAENAGEMLETE